MKIRIIILAVALLVTAFFMIRSNISDEESVNTQPNQMSDISATNDMSELTNSINETAILPPNTDITHIPTQTSEIIDDFIPNPTTQDSVFAQITIKTDKKTRTFDVMPDVDEKTLKRNIGWLPSSALPGQEGLCVLMGHRDMSFRILEDIIVGDKLIITQKGNSYSYKITGLEVIESDSALRFESLTGSNLILVTCYPFRYTGHAPKKLIIYSTITNYFIK